jgi:far upstream element-binding protein
MFSFLSIICTATIQQIQDQSGASIQVPRTGNVDNPAFRTLMITHPNEQGAEHAKQLIENVLKSKPSFQPSAQQMQHPQGGPNNGHGQYNQATSIQISIPDKDVGLCIGRGGCVIKHMQQVTQCRIQIPPSAMAGESYRVATISGPPEGCNQVQQMIARIIAEQSSASIMSGAPFSNDYQNPRNGGGGGGNMQHGQHNHHYSQPQQNQQGYSAEWAAYHAAQAAAAAAQEQVATATAASAVASASESTTTATATATTSEYHEQFFRYAYYYGEPAARQYYGAWSPAEGTPNPYGVNPAGIAPAPDASAAAATAAAPADAQQVAAAPPAPASEASFRPAATATHAAAVVAAEPEAPRETSRRHVSNLPAWMTKKT